jgi:hypothetical protein
VVIKSGGEIPHQLSQKGDYMIQFKYNDGGRSTLGLNWEKVA